VLGGTCVGTESGLVFRWSGSPLRIDVRIDPAAAEGPLAIEVGASLPRGLPEGPHPVLGIAFLAVAKGDRAVAPAPGS
jgi:hypothetical protein